MNKVYVWTPEFGRVGHCSMDISFGGGKDKAAYVSFWPDFAANLWSNEGPSTHVTYADDLKAEEGDPDLVYEVSCLDEEIMRASWAAVVRAKPSYGLFRSSCATQVANLLYAGGGRYSAEANQLYVATGAGFWSPRGVGRFVDVINRNAETILDALGREQKLHKAPIPAWLQGWWSVTDGEQYYYYFSNLYNVTYTKMRPVSASMPPLNQRLNEGKVTIVTLLNQVVIEWNPADGGATKETFTWRAPLADRVMAGVSNRYGPLVAQKLF